MTYRRVVIVEVLLVLFFLSLTTLDPPTQQEEPLERPPRMFLASGDSFVEGAIESFCRENRTGGWDCIQRPVQPGSFPTRAALTTLRVGQGEPISLRFTEAKALSELGLFGEGPDDASSLQSLERPEEIRYRLGDTPWRTITSMDGFLPPSSTTETPLVFHVRWQDLNATYVFQLDTDEAAGIQGIDNLLPE